MNVSVQEKFFMGLVKLGFGSLSTNPSYFPGDHDLKLDPGILYKRLLNIRR